MANESTAPGPGVPAPQPIPESRMVGAGRGLSWWVEGWRLFTPNVGTWLLIALILVVLGAIVAALEKRVPVLGELVSLVMEILWPVVIGGLMLGCRAVDRGNPLLVAHLFAGFRQRTRDLVMVGAIYTGLLIVIVLVIGGMMLAIFGVEIFSVLSDADTASPTGVAFTSAVIAVLLGCLFFLLLLLPLVMAIWFAPALIMLAGLSPVEAMKASFAGCLRNVVPFLVYGLIGVLLAIVASIPLGLGWFVLVPVAIASIYASYCDIFEDRDNV
jgi:uncharacterized membrane protein